MKKPDKLPVWIDPELQPQFKAYCAKKKLNMKEVVEDFIINLIARKKEESHEKISASSS